MEKWPEIVKKARARLLKMHYESRVGHIGGNLSCLDALLILFHKYRGHNDAVVLSKGHSAGALYIALWSSGVLADELLSTFHKDGTKLSGHPAPNWIQEIPFATGSLGHGLSLASGMALGNRLQNKLGIVFCVMSDGEWQEGSTWEALIFATHQRLSNLKILIDLNGLQGFGSTEEVASLGDLPSKLRTFDVELLEIDGHDCESIESALQRKVDRPLIIVMKTVKGKGISFLENRMDSHYLPLTDDQYSLAIKEVLSG